MLALTLAADHVRDGIRVNCVTPGTVETPWVGRLLEGAGDPVAELAALRARQPLGRLVGAGEVAAAIAYLAATGQQDDHVFITATRSPISASAFR